MVVRGIITLLIVKGDYSIGHRAKRTERDKPIDEGALPVDGCSQYYGDSQPVGAFGASRGAACEARGLSSTGVGLPMDEQGRHDAHPPPTGDLEEGGQHDEESHAARDECETLSGPPVRFS